MTTITVIGALLYIQTSRDLGLYLREQRRAMGLTQQELADRVGATRQWVRLLEAGRPRLALGLVMRACNALGLSIDFTPHEGPAAAP